MHNSTLDFALLVEDNTVFLLFGSGLEVAKHFFNLFKEGPESSCGGGGETKYKSDKEH